MTTWPTTIVVLVVLTAAIQAYVIYYMGGLLRDGGKTVKLEGKAQQITSGLALAAFFVFTFVPAVFGRHGILYFTDNLPFRPTYAFVADILKVPGDRPDLATIYVVIWKVLAFVLPCLLFILINTSVTTAVWDKIKYNSRYHPHVDR